MRLCNCNNCDLFRMDSCEESMKPVGRARGRRRLHVCGPATVSAHGPREPALGLSELSSKVKVNLSLPTPLRHTRKWTYSSTNS